MSRRSRRARAHAVKVSRACVLQAEELAAFARFDYARMVELRDEVTEAWADVGRGRQAPLRRRRARMAKRIAARYGAQHYASAAARRHWASSFRRARALGVVRTRAEFDAVAPAARRT